MSRAESVVSTGSSHGTSMGGSRIELQTLKPGGDDDFGDDSKHILTGMFGVLYTVSKEKHPNWQFVTFRTFLDWLQLFLIVVSPQFGFNGWINEHNKAWQVFSFIQLNQFLSGRGYTFFSVLLYVFAAGLLVIVVLGVWVGHSFQQNRFDHVWPITTMRWLGFIYFQLLDIASLTLFLIPLDCQMYGRAAAVINHNQEFPSVYCWEMPHLIQVIVSVICLAAFVPLASFFIMGEMELNLVTKNLLAMAHSKVEVYGFFLKTAMTFCSVFLSKYQHMSIAQLVLSLLQVGLYGYWVPHYYNAMNHVRVGSYTAILWSSITMVAQTWGSDTQHYHTLITNAMWIGQVPAFVLGCTLSYLRLYFFHVVVLQRFKVAPPGTKAKNIYRFSDAREVEIVGRVCRKWLKDDDEVLDAKAVELAESVMKAGLTLLPSDPFMIILYSSFLIDVQTSCQSGYMLLQTAKKASPSFLEKFAIFSREQQHTQNKSSGGGNAGQPTDLISYVEFERNYRLAKKVHRDALVAMRNFWSLLPHSLVHFETLATSIATMDTAVQAAERVYRMVLQRHTNNVKLVRLYAKFLELVKHDPWSASKWFAEADKLEQQAEDIRNSNVFGDLVVDDPHVRAALESLGNTRPGQHVPAVFIMDAHSNIQMTNPTAADLFGYDKARNELVGRNVNILIPPPFSEHHSTYVRSFIVTGKETILNKQNEFVALHKERHVFPIQLTVSKVSGIGEDTLLMALIEPVTPEPDTAVLWMLENGQMLCVDEAYTDWFAFKPSDVVGGTLDCFLPRARDAERVLSAIDRLAREVEHAAKHPPTVTTTNHPHDGYVPPNRPSTDQSRPTSAVRKRLSNLESEESLADADAAAEARRRMTRRASFLMVGNLFGRAEGSMLGAEEKSSIQGLPSTAPTKPEVRVAGVQVQHKYADTSEVEVAVTSGGIGGYKFFQLIMRRSKRQELLPHMFVADKRGKIMHITRALCTLLGTTPRALMANDLPHAMEALLPQPFAQLHRKLQTSLPLTAPPLYSCRSGLSVLLAATSRSTQHTLPFRLHMQKRDLLASDEAYHLVTLEQRSLEQALSERRLVLLLDRNGVIQSVSDMPVSLFGFKTQHMVGTSAAALVDVFGGAAANGGKDELRKVLLMLATRATESPGVSWRVNVLPPAETHDEDSLNSVVLYKATPAMMSIVLKPAAPSIRFADTASPRTSPALPTSSGEAMLEVTLWRSSLACGVIEVDATGQVLNSKDLPLYPPGLLLGTSTEQMRGNHIGNYLPMLAAQPLVTLFDADGLGTSMPRSSQLPGGFVDDDVLKKRSNLKPPPISAAMRNEKAGPLHYVRVRHLGDGAEVQLTVQAVRKESARAAGALYLVIHPHQPTGGRPDLCQYLQGGGGSAGTVMKPAASTMVSTSQLPSQLAAGTAQWPPLQIDTHSLGPTNSLTRIVDNQSQARRALDPTDTANNTPSMASSRRGNLEAVSSGMNCQGSRPASPAATRCLDTATAVGLQEQGVMQRLCLLGQSAAAGAGGGEEAEGHRQVALPMLADPSTDPVGGFEKHMSQSGADSPSLLPSAVNQAVMLRSDSGLDRPSREWRSDEFKKSVQFGSPQSDVVNAWVASAGTSTTVPTRFGQLTAPSPMPSGPQDITLETCNSGLINLMDDEGLAPRSSDGGISSHDGRAEDDKGDAHEERHSHTVSDTDEAIMSGVDAIDYRRGTRFKKLARMLASNHVGVVEDVTAVTKVQKDMRRFRNHTLVWVAILFALDIAIFAMFHQLISSQTAGVISLHNAGTAVRKANEVYFGARQLDLIYSGRFVKGLKGLSSAADLNKTKSTYITKMEEFKTFHNAFYLGPSGNRRLPSGNGLGQIWDERSIHVTQYEELSRRVTANGTIVTDGTGNVTAVATPFSVNMSLWELGNTFLNYAGNLVQNSDDYNATHKGTGISSWAKFKFLLDNGPGQLTTKYLETLDNQVSLVLGATASLNSIQRIVMILEGIVLVLVGVCYVWFIVAKVSKQRFNIYNVFMVLPQGLVRGLATKRLDLDGEDGEDDDDDGGLAKQADSAANPNVLTSSNLKSNSRNLSSTGVITTADGKDTVADADGSAHNGGGTWTRKMSMIKLSVSKSFADGNGSVKGRGRKDGGGGLWAGMARLAGMFRNSNAVVPSGRRKLQASMRATLLMTLPFLCWGVAIVAFSVAGISKVQAITSPIASFNMVNFVMVRQKLLLHLMQELCANKDVTKQEAYRSAIRHALSDMENDYTVLLYGAAALPGATNRHYKLTTDGLAYSKGIGKTLLFYTTDCLSAAVSDCKAKTSPYYQDTRNGLDRMVKNFMFVADAVSKETDLEPLLNGTEYAYLMTTKPDITGAFQYLEVSYQQYVEDTFKDVATLHVIGLVFSLVILVAFLTFILRPFLAKLRNETRRIAELLSLLPPEIDVETLLQQALTAPAPSATATKGVADEDYGHGIHSSAPSGLERSNTKSKLSAGGWQAGTH